MTGGDEILGRGVADCFATAEGAVCMAAGAELVEQSIRLILGTARGERLMRPDFGCRIHDHVFGNADATTAAAISIEVDDALAVWEPRIEVLDVTTTVDGNEPHLLHVEIDYRIRATNSRMNLVYPFYLR